MNGFRSSTTLSLVVCIAALVIVPSGTAAGGRSGDRSIRATAERKVLALLSQRWRSHRMPQLVNPRTMLPWNNVRAVCYTPVRRADRFGRGGLMCVVRPAGRSRAKLYASYAPLPRGGARIRLVSFTAGRHHTPTRKKSARPRRPRPDRSKAVANPS